MNCPNCNYTVPEGNDSCPVCGCRLPEQKKGGGTMGADKIILIVAGILAACLLLVLIPVGIASGNNGRSGLFTHDQPGTTLPPAPEATAEPETPVRMGEFISDESYFYCDTDQVVTFILSEAEGPEAPHVVWDDEVVGTMHDDGVDGDIAAGDGVFSLSVPFNIPAAQAGTHECFAVMGGVNSNTVTLVDCTDSDLDRADDVFDEIDAHLHELEAGFVDEGTDEEKLNSALETYNHMKAYLQNEEATGNIEELIIEGLSFTVLMKGGTYVYEFNPGDVAKALGFIVSSPLFFTSSTEVTPGGEEIRRLILSAQPYKSELGGTAADDAAQAIANADENYEFTNNADNGLVSVELLADLTAYKVIIWDGHGGYSSSNHSFFGTGTMWDDMSPIWNADRVGRNAALIELSGGSCGVTGRFFDKYYADKKMDHALLYLGVCHGMDDNVLCESLVRAGFDTIFAYEHSVSSGYDARMIRSVFNAMIEPAEDGLGSVTAAEALRRAKEENGETDDTDEGWLHDLWNWITGEEDEPAVLKLYGNREYRLFTHDGILSGRVSGALTPMFGIEGAQVVAANSENSASVTTNSSGNYTIELPGGSYVVTISAPGYITFNCYADIASDAVTYMQTFLLVEGEEGESGTASGTVINSLSGTGEEGVTLRFVKDWNSISGEEPIGEVLATVVTGSSGTYSVELPLGNYTAIATKEGFLTDSFNIVVQTIPTPNQDGTITPRVEGNSYLITLTWDENPRDMDLHVVGWLPDGTRFHTYYGDEEEYYNGELVCGLDYDDTTSYGPEHITLNAISDTPYYFYVHRYAGSGTTASSGATITVHRGNVLIATYHVPTDLGSGNIWNVFAIVNGRIVTRNTITDSSETGYAS